MNISKRSKQAGFSLIELVIAVSILAILAGVIAPRVTQFSQRAQISRAANDLKAIGRTVEYVFNDLGVFPRNVTQGLDPGVNSINPVPAALRDAWDGPYIASWPDTHPWGGEFDYEYRSFPAWNFDGTAGNEVVLAMRGGTLSRQILEDIDDAMDDGVRNTGTIQHNNNNVLFMYIGEGPRW